MDVNECDRTPCRNRGTCTNLHGGYSCACRPGYTGTNCETDIDDCAPSESGFTRARRGTAPQLAWLSHPTAQPGHSAGPSPVGGGRSAGGALPSRSLLTQYPSVLLGCCQEVLLIGGFPPSPGCPIILPFPWAELKLSWTSSSRGLPLGLPSLLTLGSPSPPTQAAGQQGCGAGEQPQLPPQRGLAE